MQEGVSVTVQMSLMIFVLFHEHLLKIMTYYFFGTYFPCLHWDAAKKSEREIKPMLLRVGNGTPCDIRTRKYAKNFDQALFEGLNASFILAKIGNRRVATQNWVTQIHLVWALQRSYYSLLGVPRFLHVRVI